MDAVRRAPVARIDGLEVRELNPDRASLSSQKKESSDEQSKLRIVDSSMTQNRAADINNHSRTRTKRDSTDNWRKDK